MNSFKRIVAGTVAAMAMSVSAQAGIIKTSIPVDVPANPPTGGKAGPGITVGMGHLLEIAMEHPSAAWHARIGDADCNRSPKAKGVGLADCSGQIHTPNGLTANFGSLMAQIGFGASHDTGFAGIFTATDAGGLTQWYFDSNNFASGGTKPASFQATSADTRNVPAPGVLVLLGTGLLGLGLIRRQ